jgi:flotillin
MQSKWPVTRSPTVGGNPGSGYDPSVLALAEAGEVWVLLAMVAGLLTMLVIFALTYASRYVKVGPNEALVVSGRRRLVVDPKGQARAVGFRIVKGGGTFVWPVIEQAEVLNLEVVPVDVGLSNVYSSDGVPVRVSLRAEAKVRGDEAGLTRAAEHVLSRTKTEIAQIVRDAIEGALRAEVARRTSRR